MATVTHIFTIEYAAKLLGEDPELLEAIISNDDNLTYGTIIYVCTGTDESVNTLTEDGIDELRDMLKDARRRQEVSGGKVWQPKPPSKADQRDGISSENL